MFDNKKMYFSLFLFEKSFLRVIYPLFDEQKGDKMYFKKTYDWIKIALWTGVVVAIVVLVYALWNGYLYSSIAALIILLALLALLAYCKFAQVMAIRRKFVVVQETFTTLMLVYFSYMYFSDSQSLPGEKALSGARKKFDAAYEKSRYSLTMPLVMTGLKTFGEIKNIKNIIMSEVKSFSSFDKFNLDNAENLTSEIGKLMDKLGQMAEIIGKGFSSSTKSMEEIANETPRKAKVLATKVQQKTDKKKRTNSKTK